MSLSVRGVHKRFGRQTVLEDVSLDAKSGEMVVLLGPSGCGKSTLLRVIAGLEKADAGTVHLDGLDVTHTDPQDRDVAMVFQNYALYPHMTVRENIAYPLRLRKRPAAQVKTEIEEAARMTNLGSLLDRSPKQLSGGEQQRVAIARAVVRHPRAFLMDEPFSNLDANLRQGMRSEWKRLHANLGRVTLFVTHDQAEALSLADRIAVMNAGRLVQFGTPREIYHQPEDLFVARFIGSHPMNLMNGEIRNGRFIAPGVEIAAPDLEPGPVTLGIRPPDLELTAPQSGEIQARVEGVEFLGESSIVVLDVYGKTWTWESSYPALPNLGKNVGLKLPTPSIKWFSSMSGKRLVLSTANR